MASFVALDIETTGLDPNTDMIIEIGAVKFNYNRIEDEFSTLIHPGRRIPPFITQLTGISDQMVLQSPAINDVLPELIYFIGNEPVLGHNIRFDLSFFKKFRMFESNEKLDTYEMAAVLLPTASRYNLGALAQSLNILIPATHRALDDAHATRAVFLKLIEEADQLATPVLAELVRLSENLDWGAVLPFKEILRKRIKTVISPQQFKQQTIFGSFFKNVNDQPPIIIEPKEELIGLNIDEVASILEQGGGFSRHFPNYEFRPQQMDMLRSIAKAFSENHHLMVEAGTGVGKSMAYLIPAAMWALQNNVRVVISTNTINLQDQLFYKDIPDLCDATKLNLRSVILKGRSNYLCPRRFEYFRHRGPETIEEMRVLGKILVWIQASQTGDRSEINLNGPIERNIWVKISAEDEGCTTENCITKAGGTCPFFQARQKALGAHLIIVNHALLLADVATGNRVLPDYQYLIVDEAHHLEEATTEALSYQISQSDIDWLLRELGGVNSGALGWLLAATQGILEPGNFATLSTLVDRLSNLAFRFDSVMRSFFSGLTNFLTDKREGRSLGLYSQQERILPATRTLPIWGEVELSWDDALQVLDPMIEILGKIHQGISEINDHLQEGDNELYGIFHNLLHSFIDFKVNIDGLVFKPMPEMVYWIEIQPANHKISIHTAPIHIGALMERFLWMEKSSVILTSATLTTTGEFDYIRGRLNAENANELALGSPFDYENSALLYIVNNIPEPADRSGHQKAVEKCLLYLTKVTGGKMLVLFTSYEQLKRTSQAISPQLAKQDIIVYEQGEGASPHSLLETFRYSERAILLGTRAFWEGVDIPGDALSILVIVKLPFDVPSNPIISARSEMFEDPFFQYSLPEAILRFRQGFGRLIRTQSDRGVVVILDSRVLTKRYGKMFIDSLPQCMVKTGSLENLVQVASKWLNL